MTHPPRLPDWQHRLSSYVFERASQPVDPDRPVCAEFTAGAVEAMTGAEIGIAWRDQYPTVRAGLKALRAEGYPDHVALLADMFAPIPAAFACPGDIAVLPEAGGVAVLGVVQGALIYVQTPNGIGTVPLTTAVSAFRVP